MKWPDFSENNGLNELRRQMKAELIPWDPGDPIDRKLGGEGIEIPPEEIEDAPDGTLGYEGRKVVVYIRDQYVFGSYELVDPDELVDPEQLRRFHVANCLTLKQMQSKNNYDRYVVATRTDGKFIVNFVVGNRVHEKGERVERRLYVCKHCLNTLNYKGYRKKKTQQNEIRESFALGEFFKMYGSQITDKPTGDDRTAPVNIYSSDWCDISRQYKEKIGWKCEECSINLEKRTGFLQVHHEDGQKNNNSEENLCSLCIGCHAEKFQHQHIKTTRYYQAFLKWCNQQ